MIFWSSRYCLSEMQTARTMANFTKFIALLLGSEVKFSFRIFFAIQPIPAANLVRTVASVIVLTSLLSDIARLLLKRKNKKFKRKIILPPLFSLFGFSPFFLLLLLLPFILQHYRVLSGYRSHVSGHRAPYYF